MESVIKVKIAKKIAEIPPQDWYSAYPDTLENYYFFKTLDESNLSQFSFFYIVIYINDTPAGATNCFIMDFPLDIAITGWPKRAVDFIKKFFPGVFSPRIMICGLPMGQGRIGIAAAEPGLIVEAINKAMEEIASHEKAQIIAFKDFDSGYHKILDQYLDSSFLRIDSFPSTDMDINFSSFEEYLMTLSSVSRSGLKRKFKKIDGKVKIDLEIRRQLDDGELNQAYALYLETSDRQEMGLEKLSRDFFKNISKNMPAETIFFLWKMDNKMLAFAFCLVRGGYFIDYYLGFDYSVAHQYHLYSVRFRDIINWCIENKITKYEMGATAYEVKRRLGFNLIPLCIYVKHRNKFLNPIFKILCRMVQPTNFHPVFKELK